MAKQGLNKTWDLRQIWSHFLETKNRREREGRGKERRRGKGREEEEKRGRRREVQQAKRYETIKLEYGSLVCMIIILPKPRVLLGFHLNPKIMESKVGKTLNSIIRIWNPSFKDGFMV